MTFTLGCFLCGGTDHWADNCWTQTPPTSRDHHEARIVLYRIWCTDQWRVTPRQKQKLIEHENAMYARWKAQKETAK